ncbi:unnamed protein product [Caenorhabditis nigoni]
MERPMSSASSSKDSPNYVHPLTYTGDLYLDVNTVTGKDALESAAELMKTGNNHVLLFGLKTRRNRPIEEDQFQSDQQSTNSAKEKT